MNSDRKRNCVAGGVAACLLVASPLVWAENAVGVANRPASPQVLRAVARDVPIAVDEGTPAEVSKDLAAYQVGAGEFRFELARFSDGRCPGRIAFPSAKPSGDARNDTVHADWYPSGLPGRRPAAVVLHILDGRMVVGRLFSGYLAASGVHACLMHLPYYGRRAGRDGRKPLAEGDLPKAVSTIIQGVADIRRCAQVLRALPQVDPERVSVLGASLGGYAASLASGVDGRFYRSIFLLAGAPVADILLEGDRESRKIGQAMQRKGYDDRAIRRWLRPVEPARFAGRVPRGSAVIYGASRDEVIPRHCTVRLAEAMGVPESQIHWVGGTHRSVAWALPLILPRIAQQLGGSPTAAVEALKRNNLSVSARGMKE